MNQTQNNLQVGQLVKFAAPANQAEVDARFILKEHNGDRVFIELICSMNIKPVQLVRTSDIIPAE